jgi:hypothetical protein
MTALASGTVVFAPGTARRGGNGEWILQFFWKATSNGWNKQRPEVAGCCAVLCGITGGSSRCRSA